MFSIASCPRCAAQVTLPAEATAESQVRCPLCHREYALAEVFDALPPALVVVGGHGAAVVEHESPAPEFEAAGWSPEASETIEEIDNIDPAGAAEFAASDETLDESAAAEHFAAEPHAADAANGHSPEEDLDFGFMTPAEPGEHAVGEPESPLGEFEAEFPASEETLEHEEFALPLHDESLAEGNVEPLAEGEAQEFGEFEETAEGPSLDSPAEGEFMHFPEGDAIGFPEGETAESGEAEEEGATAEHNPHEGFEYEPDEGLGEAAFGEPAEGDELQPGEFSYEPAPIDGEEIPLAEDEVAEPIAAETSAEAAEAKGKKKKEKAPKAIKPKKSRSLVGTLVALLTSSVVGLGGGYLALLWLAGPTGDFLGLGPKLPGFMRPAAFNSIAAAPSAAPNRAPLADPSGATPGENGAPGGDVPAPDAAKPEADAAMEGAEKPEEKAEEGVAGDEKMPAEETAAGDKPEAAADEKAMPDEKAPAEDALAGDEKKPSAREGKEEMPAEEKPEPAEKASADDLAGDKPAKPGDDMPEDPLADDAKKPATPAEEEMTDPLLADAAPAAVVPLNAAEYTLDDVDAAMKDAQESDEIMSDPSKLAADELKKARSLYYRRLYKLGEVLTYAKDDDLAPRLADERKAAGELLKGIAADEQRLAQLGAAASKWLTYPKRGEHAGILLTGPVAKVGKQGKLYETQISIPNEADPVSVFSVSKPKLAEGDNVIVLGSVIDDPATNLPGYSGSQAIAIWSGLTTPLPAAAP